MGAAQDTIRTRRDQGKQIFVLDTEKSPRLVCLKSQNVQRHHDDLTASRFRSLDLSGYFCVNWLVLWSG
jgi:hypothetical protein